MGVPHVCEVSPVPVHVVLGSTMPNYVKETLKTALKDVSFCNLVTTCKNMGASEETGNNVYCISNISLGVGDGSGCVAVLYNSALAFVYFKIIKNSFSIIFVDVGVQFN